MDDHTDRPRFLRPTVWELVLVGLLLTSLLAQQEWVREAAYVLLLPLCVTSLVTSYRRSMLRR